MSEVTKYPPYTFAWIDLTTTDADAAKPFYTELFGWEADDMPLPMGGVYTMLKQEGKDVAALSQMQPEQQEQGMPSAWTSYISVEDVNAATEKAEQAGGTVVAPPFDVLDAGHMAVIQDPTGAMFAFWEPKRHIGARIVNIPNSLIWNELVTRDTTRASQFYQDVLGWEAKVNEGPMEYTSFYNRGRAAAGMMSMDEQWEGIPPHWGIYIEVEDVDATAARVTELGGTIITEPFDIGFGRIAVLQDPTDAVFNISTMEVRDPMP